MPQTNSPRRGTRIVVAVAVYATAPGRRHCPKEQRHQWLGGDFRRAAANAIPFAVEPVNPLAEYGHALGANPEARADSYVMTKAFPDARLKSK